MKKYIIPEMTIVITDSQPLLNGSPGAGDISGGTPGIKPSRRRTQWDDDEDDWLEE
ncbi:MAG: hypothetical protein K6A96_03570 [Prevotella sp.]|jgi:hypothetical protein|nr:hypothetical protein [Prevotella sp.]